MAEPRELKAVQVPSVLDGYPPFERAVARAEAEGETLRETLTPEAFQTLEEAEAAFERRLLFGD